jgi:multidrug efflux pump subunit AcrA (membrane-fusion protein)
MSDENKDPVGQPSNPAEKKDEKFVPLESHRGLLDEMKKKQAKYETEKAELNAKLAEYEAEKKAREERELSEQKRFEDLAKLREQEVLSAKKEAEKLKAVLEASAKEREEEKKRQAVLEKVKFKKQEYADKFLDVSSVDLSDPTSVDALVAKIKTDFPDLIVPSAATPPSTQAPSNGSFGDFAPKNLKEAQMAMKQELAAGGLSALISKGIGSSFDELTKERK